MVEKFLGETVGIIIDANLPINYAKEGKGGVYVRYTGRYHAPIFLCYKEGKPCKLDELIGLPVIIKWGQDIDQREVTRTYIFIHHWPNIKASDEIRMLLVSEKDVMAGAWIKYCPREAIIDEKYFSSGGTHWQRFIMTKEKSVAGVRVTATKNNHNQYEIAA